MNWFKPIISWLGSLLGLSTPSADPVKVAQIQAAAVKACGFLPMADSVAALVAAQNPAVASVTLVAAQICRVVLSRPTAQPTMGLMSSDQSPDAPPVAPTWGEINGVPIQGVFIR